jgi:hypothetical protein
MAKISKIQIVEVDQLSRSSDILETLSILQLLKWMMPIFLWLDAA